MPDYYPFDPSPRTPAEMPPAKTCDSQFHVLGPRDVYPIRPGAAYEMPSATWDAALRMHRALGIERGIIVQTTTYGADHAVVLDALAAMGPNYKACANALVFLEADDAYLAKLDAAGVRGARFSFRQALGAVLNRVGFHFLQPGFHHLVSIVAGVVEALPQSVVGHPALVGQFPLLAQGAQRLLHLSAANGLPFRALQKAFGLGHQFLAELICAPALPALQLAGCRQCALGAGF